MHGCGEYDISPLSGLNRSCDEGAAVADVFDVVDYRDFCVTGEDEVAVHAMYGEVLGDRVLGCREALCYYGTSIDTASSGRMPKRTSVCIEVLQRRN